MIKKYRLIPEKEYERWKSSNASCSNSSTETNDGILDSKLPDDLKIKLFQDQKRVECNERDRAEMVNRMGAPLTFKKDVEVQHAEPQAEIGTSPMKHNVEENNQREETPLKHKSPKRLKSSSSSPDFQKESMQRIARFLATCGIKGNKQGSLFIDDKMVPESDYVATIRQLSDARVKRTAATNIVINALKKHAVPDNMFSARIMNEFMKSNVNASSDVSSPIQWSSF